MDVAVLIAARVMGAWHRSARPIALHAGHLVVAMECVDDSCRPKLAQVSRARHDVFAAFLTMLAMTDARLAYEPILNMLLPLYRMLHTSGSLPPARIGYRKVPHIGHGWFMRVQRGVETILYLETIGYTEEAVAISRSVIEHVVALKWLAVDGDSILDTVALGHKYGAEKLLNATSDATWNVALADEIEAAIVSVEADQRDPSNNHYLHFIARNKMFGNPHTLPGYYASVARVHPTYESAMAYVELPNHEARYEPKPTLWQVPFCTSELLEALIVYRTIFDPPPWFEDLKPLLTEYLAVTDEVRAQEGLSPVDWPGSADDVLRVGE